MPSVTVWQMLHALCLLQRLPCMAAQGLLKHEMSATKSWGHHTFSITALKDIQCCSAALTAVMSLALTCRRGHRSPSALQRGRAQSCSSGGGAVPLRARSYGGAAAAGQPRRDNPGARLRTPARDPVDPVISLVQKSGGVQWPFHQGLWISWT